MGQNGYPQGPSQPKRSRAGKKGHQNRAFQGQATPMQPSVNGHNNGRNSRRKGNSQHKGQHQSQHAPLHANQSAMVPRAPAAFDSAYNIPTMEHDDEGAVGDNELEEGELSEGEIDEDNESSQALPPILNNAMSYQANGKATYDGAAYHVPAPVLPFGFAYPTAHATTASSSDPSRQPLLESDAAKSRRSAKDAILRLWPLNVRFADYINEGIDRQLLRGLFEELGLDAPAASPASTAMSLDVISDDSLPVNETPSEPLPITSGPGSVEEPVQVPLSTALLAAAPENVSNVTQPTTSVTGPKSVTPSLPAASGASATASANPLEERKDRIARLLAAKNSKKAASATTPTVADPQSVINGSKDQTPALKPMSEKSRLVQQKMEALRKAREVQAQKATASAAEDPLTKSSPAQVRQMPVPAPSPPVQRPALHKSVSMPPSSPLTRAQASPKVGQPAVPNGFSVAPPTGPSKRPAASDFNDLSEAPSKRPFAQSRKPQPFLIDVSDDDGDAAMDLDSPELDSASLHRASSPFKIPSLHSFGATPTAGFPRQFSTPAMVGTPPTGPKSDRSKNNLDSMNKEIELMKLRIAEAEARKKAKSSGTGSPSILPSSENLGESSRGTSKPPFSVAGKSSPIPGLSVTSNEHYVLGSPGLSGGESPALKLPKQSELRRAGVTMRARSRAASERLPVIEAHRREQLLKLEALKSQIAKIEKEMAISLQEEESLRLEAMEGSESDDGVGEFEADEASSKKVPVDVAGTAEPVVTDGSAAPMETDSGHSGKNSEEAFPEQVETEAQPSRQLSEKSDESTAMQLSTILDAAANPQEHTNVPDTNTQVQQSPSSEAGSAAMSQGDSAADSGESDQMDAESSSGSEDSTGSSSRIDTTNDDTSPIEASAAPALPNSISAEQRVSSPAAPSEVANMSFPILIAQSPNDPTQDQDILPAKPDAGGFVAYDSPLQYFHAYRFHPQYQDAVSKGLRSLTYSHKIDANLQLCPDQLAGNSCPRGSECDYQHFESLGIPDDQILVQLGAYEGDRKSEFIDGLKKLLTDFRSRKVRDFETISQGIIDYRAQFRGDKTKILPLGNVSL